MHLLCIAYTCSGLLFPALLPKRRTPLPLTTTLPTTSRIMHTHTRLPFRPTSRMTVTQARSAEIMITNMMPTSHLMVIPHLYNPTTSPLAARSTAPRRTKLASSLLGQRLTMTHPSRILLPCPCSQTTMMANHNIKIPAWRMALNSTPFMMQTRGVGAVVVLILHLCRNLALQTTTILVSRTLILSTDAPVTIRLPLHSHCLMIGCAQQTTANDSPASHSLTLSGQHAARSATRKALPRTLRRMMPRRARAPRVDANADSTLTPLLAGILLVSASAVQTASTQLGPDTQRPATKYPARQVLPAQQYLSGRQQAYP